MIPSKKAHLLNSTFIRHLLSAFIFGGSIFFLLGQNGALAALAGLTLLCVTILIAMIAKQSWGGLIVARPSLESIGLHSDSSAQPDSLTGLTSPVLMQDRIGQMILSSARLERSFSVILIDIDNFKYVNDAMGSEAGDVVLKQFATRLQSVLRVGDTACRLHGDVFALILPDAPQSSIHLVAEKILRSNGDNFYVNNNRVVIRLSIGSSSYPADGDSADDLIRNADVAMRKSKLSGGNGFRSFDSAMDGHSSVTFLLKRDIKMGLGRGEFFLEFQPKVDTKTLMVVGVEALLRWRHPKRGMVSPAIFIPAAEKTGQILQLGDMVLKESFLAVRNWRAHGFDISIAVNVSSMQICHRGFAAKLKNLALEMNIDPSWVELEITEGTMVDYEKGEISQTMSELIDAGFSISIDDFGTGYSNLGYLKKMRAATIKIDQSFIRNLERDKSDIAIIKSIVYLSDQFDMKVVAEGVETEFQYQIAKLLGCHIIQGYLTGRPMSWQSVMDLINSQGALIDIGNTLMADQKGEALPH